MPVRKFFLLCLALLALVPLAFAMSSGVDQVTVTTATGKRLVFNVELAVTPEEHRRGLMFRKSMPEDTGMLFISEKPEMQNFWMKNTFISLDMLFINEQGIITHIHHQAQPHDLTGISSLTPVKAVLEIKGGIAYREGITEGDRVEHKVFLAP